MKTTLSLVVLLALGSCSSPPKPPSADEAKRHPVNAATEVGLQTCKGELQNARILVSEKTGYADSLRSRLAAMFAARSAATALAEEARSSTYTILFPFGATSVVTPLAASDALVARAKNAPLIVLSGRTDGISDTPAEGRVARERAEYVRDVLVRGGIPAARIRTTWQPVGDHAADNTSTAGKALNRRVEIEIYRAAPRAERLDPANAA